MREHTKPGFIHSIYITYGHKKLDMPRVMKRLRLWCGEMTQAEAGRRIGKPQSYISAIELGRKELSTAEYLRLAKVYGCRNWDDVVRMSHA